MGLFDTYLPSATLHCPVCSGRLHEWQGYQGPNALLFWREGIADPVGGAFDDEDLPEPHPAHAPRQWSLPERFVIESHDCGCPYPVQAVGHVEDGIWRGTVLIDSSNAAQGKHETRAQWAARRAWLHGRLRH